MKTESAYWESHVAALNREAIPVTTYARQHGLSVSTLYYWRRKFKMAGEQITDTNAVGKFISLRVGDSPATPRVVGCTLVLGINVRLELPALPAPEWLAALAHATGAR